MNSREDLAVGKELQINSGGLSGRYVITSVRQTQSADPFVQGVGHVRRLLNRKERRAKAATQRRVK